MAGAALAASAMVDQTGKEALFEPAMTALLATATAVSAVLWGAGVIARIHSQAAIQRIRSEMNERIPSLEESMNMRIAYLEQGFHLRAAGFQTTMDAALAARGVTQVDGPTDQLPLLRIVDGS